MVPIIVLFLILPLKLSGGANILFYFPNSGMSHRLCVWPIIEQLSLRGHHSTFISPYPPKQNLLPLPSNVTDIVLKGLSESLGVVSLDFVGIRLNEGVAGIDALWHLYSKMGERGCAFLYRNEEFLNLVNSSTFDLIVINSYHAECGYALAHKWNAKIIVFSPTSHFPWFKESFGLPDENLPDMQFHFPKDMTFLQSVRNELVSLYWEYWYRNGVAIPLFQKIVEESLGMEIPPLLEIEKNTSLIFTYTSPVEEYPRSLPPNFIEVGGMNCVNETKPLPKDLESFISSGKSEGFILLSFGTYASLSTLPFHLQEIFFSTMGKFKMYKFIVRYNGDVPAGVEIAENIKLAQWIPQQDTLAHPKIKALIGHGGLLGTYEAICHGVPMIVLPFFVEQDYQAGRAHERQTAIKLEIGELTEKSLVQALTSLIKDNRYKENTMKLRRAFLDRPWSPVEKAVWWMEYVLRTDDFSHLRPVGWNRTWYERRMLHIWGFITLSLIVSVLLFCYFVGKIVSLRCRKEKVD